MKWRVDKIKMHEAEVGIQVVVIGSWKVKKEKGDEKRKSWAE